MLVMRAIDLDKAGTRPFFGGFVTDNENVTFYTRGVTGSREFVAHEMTIEFRSGGDIESIGIVKGQSVSPSRGCVRAVLAKGEAKRG